VKIDGGERFAFVSGNVELALSPAGDADRVVPSDRVRGGNKGELDSIGNYLRIRSMDCLDEAPVLQRLQERYGKDGLEIVGSFEISNDLTLAKKNLRLFSRPVWPYIYAIVLAAASMTKT